MKFAFRMFNLFPILLLLIAGQIVQAIQIWVKPSVLRYTARIGCLNSDGPITIGVATYSQLRGSWTPEYRDGILAVWGTPGYVDISTQIAISRCGHDNPTVHVRITNLDNPNEWMEEMLKIELLARKSAVVLGFNIAPSARKIFYFHQFPPILRFFQRRLVNCELEIVCLNMDADGTPHNYLIGSGVQFNEHTGINIPIYETERLAFCSQDKITLVIHRDEREKTTDIELTKQSFLENDAFNINMSNKTVRSTQVRTQNDDPVLSRTIVSSSSSPSGASSSTTGHPESSTMATPIPSGASSSTTGQTESSTMATPIPSGASSSTTAHPESSTMATPQTVRPSPQTESDNECVVCCVRQERPEIAFVPCGHICVCSECSEEIIKKKNECPICRQKIEKHLRIYFSS